MTSTQSTLAPRISHDGMGLLVTGEHGTSRDEGAQDEHGKSRPFMVRPASMNGV